MKITSDLTFQTKFMLLCIEMINYIIKVKIGTNIFTKDRYFMSNEETFVLLTMKGIVISN